MNSYDADLPVMAEAHRPSVAMAERAKKEAIVDSRSETASSTTTEPTMEELKTLRRVSGEISWQMMTVTFVEFCERFSYYGTTAVFVNFIQQPRPYGSRTGNIQETAACFAASTASACRQPGGLGMDQQAATGLTTFNQFWAYVMPLVGGWIADSYLGRYATIQWSILAAIIGHVLLICSSIPTVMDNPSGALGLFAVGLVIMGIGTGGFKSNISPLLAEQIKETRPEVITLDSGERVIKDPQVTISRVFLYFYMMINLGALAGGIGMVYAERFVGFWLAYALPTFLFFGAPLVLLACRKYYILTPPTGSVLSKSFALLKLASRGCWSPNPVRTYRNMKREGFWDDVKPSRLGSNKPSWMRSFDDAWVDQVARGKTLRTSYRLLYLLIVEHRLPSLQSLLLATALLACVQPNGQQPDITVSDTSAQRWSKRSDQQSQPDNSGHLYPSDGLLHLPCTTQESYQLHPYQANHVGILHCLSGYDLFSRSAVLHLPALCLSKRLRQRGSLDQQQRTRHQLHRSHQRVGTSSSILPHRLFRNLCLDHWTGVRLQQGTREHAWPRYGRQSGAKCFLRRPWSSLDPSGG